MENDLTDLIIQLPISEPLSAGEYIRCDDNEEYGEEASIKDIADVIRGVWARLGIEKKMFPPVKRNRMYHNACRFYSSKNDF